MFLEVSPEFSHDYPAIKSLHQLLIIFQMLIAKGYIVTPDCVRHIGSHYSAAFGKTGSEADSNIVGDRLGRR